MTVKGLLLDLQGVLYQDGLTFEGAPQAVAALRARGLALRFLTNTTTRPRYDIVARMRGMGFDVEENQVFTPACSAASLLTDLGVHRIHLAAPTPLAEDFSNFALVDEGPEAIVLGDLHTGFTWSLLDELFTMIHEGAKLIALHKNRYCRIDNHLSLDLGPFVALLEYAADTQALVVGKPSQPFFHGAVTDMGLTPGDVVMIGDDLEADIGGALNAGLRAVQVQTGKYSARDEANTDIRPTARIPSIADFPAWLDNGQRHGEING